MKSGLRVTGILMAAIALFMASHGLAQKPQRPTQPFMRQKLVYAQGILEGITLEKFDLVITNATLLRDMSTTNAFLILRNPSYMERVTYFQAAVDRLKAAATEQSLQRATEAYAQVTSSCVECHRYFRRDQALRR
jgi:Cytochrome C'